MNERLNFKMQTPWYKKVQRSVSVQDLSVEIVGNILSRLSVKEAIATSILWKVFRHMWRSIDSLDFDAIETLRGFSDEGKQVRDEKTSSYVNCVTHVVRQLKEEVDSNLKLFRACFHGIDERHRTEVDEWVRFEMTRRVQVLVLDFLAAGSQKWYIFPHKHAGGFKCLKALVLECVDVTQDTLNDLLRNSPSLERLRLWYTESFSRVEIIGAVALKSLEMGCNQGLKAIEIRNARLFSVLSYKGLDPIDVVVENVPLLSEAKLSYFTEDSIRIPFSQLSSCISQLHTLMMSIRGINYRENHSIPELPNLKRFELEVNADNCWGNLGLLTSFLKAFPHLCTLVLKMHFFESFATDPFKLYVPRNEGEVTTYPHHYLTVLEIVRYIHRLNAVEHVRHIIKTAVALEKIVINPVHWEFHHTGADRTERDALMEEVARKGALEMLKEFVVLLSCFVRMLT